MTDEELAKPDFAHATRVHDWRNHIGRRTKELWDEFTPKQQRALYEDADEEAGYERWD